MLFCTVYATASVCEKVDNWRIPFIKKHCEKKNREKWFKRKIPKSRPDLGKGRVSVRDGDGQEKSMLFRLPLELRRLIWEEVVGGWSFHVWFDGGERKVRVYRCRDVGCGGCKRLIGTGDERGGRGAAGFDSWL